MDQTKHSVLKVHSDVVQSIKEIAEKEHIDLAHAIQVVKLQEGLETPALPDEK